MLLSLDERRWSAGSEGRETSGWSQMFQMIGKVFLSERSVRLKSASGSNEQCWLGVYSRAPLRQRYAPVAMDAGVCRILSPAAPKAPSRRQRSSRSSCMTLSEGASLKTDASQGRRKENPVPFRAVTETKLALYLPFPSSGIALCGSLSFNTTALRFPLCTPLPFLFIIVFIRVPYFSSSSILKSAQHRLGGSRRLRASPTLAGIVTVACFEAIIVNLCRSRQLRLKKHRKSQRQTSIVSNPVLHSSYHPSTSSSFIPVRRPLTAATLSTSWHLQ